jgi:hypothetical protein
MKIIHVMQDGRRLESLKGITVKAENGAYRLAAERLNEKVSKYESNGKHVSTS